MIKNNKNNKNNRNNASNGSNNNNHTVNKFTKGNDTNVNKKNNANNKFTPSHESEKSNKTSKEKLTILIDFKKNKGLKKPNKEMCSDPKKLDFYYAAEFRICCVFFYATKLSLYSTGLIQLSLMTYNKLRKFNSKR